MSTLFRELENLNNVETVSKIQFGILNPEEIKKASVCEVNVPETYDGIEPKINGLFDPRMGVIDYGRICPTDENNSETCPGYFGHINLALPVYHIHFVPIVMKLLKCVCFRCSNILINKMDKKVMDTIRKKSGKSRFMYIIDQCSKIKRCQNNNGCYVMQPNRYIRLTPDKIREKDNIIKIYANFADNAFNDPNISKQQLITPEVCYKIFKNISEIDCELLGFSNKYSRPEWLICTTLPVPPPSVRPSVRQDNNQRSEDDLTYALINIIKANNQLKIKIENDCPQKIINEYVGLLQYSIGTYIDNELPKVSQSIQRSGRALKAIRQRLKSKEGRIRGNIQGKRVDKSARTVISVDPNISIEEFCIPKKVAMNLTYPETVTKYNKDYLYRIIKNGPNKYPGAKNIKKIKKDCNGISSPCIISLKHVDYTNIELNEGDIVYRHLKDGDVALFNRQPSLHRMSMMGHKIKIIDHNTFRLNVTVCKPYNADFDGDEMNMHLPQTIQTMNELTEIALVPTQIISPSSSKPIISIVQDTLMGAYMFTKKDFRLHKSEVYNLLSFLKIYNGNLDINKEFWTGKEVFSLILPRMSYISNNSSDKLVKIENGNIIEGYLDGKLLGGSGFIQTIHNMYNENTCKDFLDNTQLLITRWMMKHSFSIGFGDILPTRKDIEEMEEVIENSVIEANNLIKKAQIGEYHSDQDDDIRKKIFENEIKFILHNGQEKVMKYLVSNMDDENSVYEAVISGSKGKKLNIQQMMGLVGQQEIWGNRIVNGFTDRTLPHFHKNDQAPVSRGFCRNSFIKGLTPAEFFYHAMSGRTGSIDTAIRTADSGYISRRLIKAMEDLKVCYDGTVRNAYNTIIQFVYGDDNFDPVKIERQLIKYIEFDNKKMRDIYYYAPDTNFDYIIINSEMKISDNVFELLDDEYNRIINSRDIIRNKYFNNIDIIRATEFKSPVNLYRLIHSTQKKFNINEKNISDITPKYVINNVKKLLDYINNFYLDKTDLSLLSCYIISFLSSKRCISEYKMSKLMFDYLIEKIKYKIITAFIQPGELVGIVAAQSLGEPSTQMTLNTFHLAGVGSASVIITAGVPRLKELINATGVGGSNKKDIKTPSMKIYLKDPFCDIKKMAIDLQSQLEYTKLSDILIKTEITYEKNFNKVNMNETENFLQTYMEFNEILGLDNIKTDSLSPWTLKMIFNKEKILNKNIQMHDIQNKILQSSKSEENIQATFSDDNSGVLVLRLKMRDLSDDGNNLEFLKEIETIISSITIKGIPKISKASIEEINQVSYNLDGSYEQKKKWTIETEGTNLLEVMILDEVDETRTTTNSIAQIYDIFGIEGVRTKYILEFTNIFAEYNVGYRHIELLSDIMTYKGKIMQIDRHGLNKSLDRGPISKASFEEVSDVMINAGVFAEIDNVNGVSSNIMLGQFPKIGTNSFKILINDKLLEETEVHMSEGEDEEDEEYVDEDNLEILEKKINNDFKDIDNVTDDDFVFGNINTNQYKLDEIDTVNIKVNIVKDKTSGQKKTKKIKIKKNKSEDQPEEKKKEVKKKIKVKKTKKQKKK